MPFADFCCTFIPLVSVEERIIRAVMVEFLPVLPPAGGCGLWQEITWKAPRYGRRWFEAQRYSEFVPMTKSGAHVLPSAPGLADEREPNVRLYSSIWGFIFAKYSSSEFKAGRQL